MHNKSHNRGKNLTVLAVVLFLFAVLIGRLIYLMIWQSEHYTRMADDLHERERTIKAARGRILDRKGEILADNRTVCTISVIHNQITETEKVIRVLAEELQLAEEKVRARVEKYSAIERVKSNVDKQTGDRIREYGLEGVKVDEDFKRFYPHEELASKVLGFTGGDNQGIIGLEVIYEEYLQGKPGTILTVTDAKGVEIEAAGEKRAEPIAGKDLKISMDLNIQSYATQLAETAMEKKEAERVCILVMNPQNGEIYAMVDVPEFNLNDPFELNTGEELEGEKLQDALNAMWRNRCINDTYEPGSTFKIITASAGLEEGVVSLQDKFFCPGYKIVDDRRIRCHKVSGHGSENFVQAAQNSCNPVFIEVGLRLGVEKYYKYFRKFGLLEKTGIDLPGEAGTIMHQAKNMGNVELATVSFGQSFQITPIQLATTVSSLINGGRRITPHFGVAVEDENGEVIQELEYPVKTGALSEETSEKIRYILEKVVSQGSGKNAAIEGYTIGGKTATSQTLPRSANRYISSFLGFAPAENPQVLALCIIHDPKGIYYGGTIAAPVVRTIFENVLPYMGINGRNQEE